MESAQRHVSTNNYAKYVFPVLSVRIFFCDSKNAKYALNILIPIVSIESFNYIIILMPFASKNIFSAINSYFVGNKQK